MFGSPETKYSPEKEDRGQNVAIDIVFARHAQKASAAIFNQELSGISSSSISPKGAELARQKGPQVLNSPVKGYRTSSERTNETLKEMLRGTGETDEDKLDAMVGKYLGFEALSLAGPTLEKYNQITNDAKARYLSEKYPNQKYDDLSLDEQEEVMEMAEEPALQWYLDHDDQRPDSDTYSPKEMAGVIAYKLNRFANLPQYLKNGKEFQLAPVGHKTSTESFLKYMIGFKDLSEIGGSLKTLDHWNFDIKTDETGEENVTINFRGKEYPVDRSKLKELADIGRGLLEKPEQKIDQV